MSLRLERVASSDAAASCASRPSGSLHGAASLSAPHAMGARAPQPGSVRLLGAALRCARLGLLLLLGRLLLLILLILILILVALLRIARIARRARRGQTTTSW